MEEHKTITLSNGNHVLVDKEDYAKLAVWKWHSSGNHYASHHIFLGKFNGKQKFTVIMMHRMILGLGKYDRKIQVDHINGNKLDNRKFNLRLCSAQQNSRNRKISKNKRSSKYKGVFNCTNTKKYQVAIIVNKKRIYLGTFLSEANAAEAYNRAAIDHFGEFAKLNVVQS